MTTQKSPMVSFNDPTPEGAAYRGEQAMIDADIEGLADDPGAAKLMDELREAGVPVEERMERLFSYLHDLGEVEPSVVAAE